ncbi:hypothetical protein QFC22_002490 [Naganishia vaughanmartiniae]|uniref:Uncharacterized protein n=1 Tax=Naganishia vaughanmartiniae TaxID=1424756 RepID=A0ACC2XD60_9TREE|nr:hypothetical protein QFC22_002490 [Naganishia vaughanmartiniae]
MSFATPIARSAIRTSRTTSLPKRQAIQRAVRQARFNSTNAGGPNASTPAANGSSALVGGLVGGGLVVAAGYGYYYFSGVKTAVDTVRTTKDYFNSSLNTLKEKAPEPNQALEWLHETANSYAKFVPGGKSYVDAAFKDIDVVRQKHGDEVNKIVGKTYDELKKTSEQNGLSLETATKSWEVLQDALKQISALAGDAAGDILNNHPDLKKQVGGNIDKLKELGDKYGPEAKAQVDKTWDQIRDIMKSGISVGTIGKVKQLVDEKTEQIKQLGDKAWDTGLETAKPYLAKNPKIKELIEKNGDALKQGDVTTLFKKLSSGVDAKDIESYVNDAVSKAKDTASSATGINLDKYLGNIPGASDILPKINQLRELSEKHGKEAQDLAKETYDEIQQVLKKRLSEAEKITEKAKKDAK